jgi:hypothetical protein
MRAIVALLVMFAISMLLFKATPFDLTDLVFAFALPVHVYAKMLTTPRRRR